MPGPDTPTLDQAALELLYGRLETSMYNVVYRWLWDSEEAHDVVHEAFVRVWKSRHEVDMATVEALLYKTALNLASNRRRSRKLWRWVSLEALWDRQGSGGLADAELSRAQQDAVVRRAVEALPEPLRRVVMLCELSNLTYEQVGLILSIPAGTVGSRRNKALRLLRESLGNLAEVDDEAWSPARV